MLNNKNSETTQMLIFVSWQEPTSEVIFKAFYAIMPQTEIGNHSLSHHGSLDRLCDKCHVTGFKRSHDLSHVIGTNVIMCQMIAKLHVFLYVYFAKNYEFWFWSDIIILFIAKIVNYEHYHIF